MKISISKGGILVVVLLAIVISASLVIYFENNNSSLRDQNAYLGLEEPKPQSHNNSLKIEESSLEGIDSEHRRKVVLDDVANQDAENQKVGESSFTNTEESEGLVRSSPALDKTEVEEISLIVAELGSLLSVDSEVERIILNLSKAKATEDKSIDSELSYLLGQAEFLNQTEMFEKLDDLNKQKLNSARALEKSLQESLSVGQQTQLETYEKEVITNKRRELIASTIDSLISTNVADIDLNQKNLIQTMIESTVNQDLGKHILGSTIQRHNADSPQFYFETHDHMVIALSEMEQILRDDQKANIDFDAIRSMLAQL